MEKPPPSLPSDSEEEHINLTDPSTSTPPVDISYQNSREPTILITVDHLQNEVDAATDTNEKGSPEKDQNNDQLRETVVHLHDYNFDNLSTEFDDDNSSHSSSRQQLHKKGDHSRSRSSIIFKKTYSNFSSSSSSSSNSFNLQNSLSRNSLRKSYSSSSNKKDSSYFAGMKQTNENELLKKSLSRSQLQQQIPKSDVAPNLYQNESQTQNVSKSKLNPINTSIPNPLASGSSDQLNPNNNVFSFSKQFLGLDKDELAFSVNLPERKGSAHSNFSDFEDYFNINSPAFSDIQDSEKKNSLFELHSKKDLDRLSATNRSNNSLSNPLSVPTEQSKKLDTKNSSANFNSKKSLKNLIYDVERFSFVSLSKTIYSLSRQNSKNKQEAAVADPNDSKKEDANAENQEANQSMKKKKKRGPIMGEKNFVWRGFFILRLFLTLFYNIVIMEILISVNTLIPFISAFNREFGVWVILFLAGCCGILNIPLYFCQRVFPINITLLVIHNFFLGCALGVIQAQFNYFIHLFNFWVLFFNFFALSFVMLCFVFTPIFPTWQKFTFMVVLMLCLIPTTLLIFNLVLYFVLGTFLSCFFQYQTPFVILEWLKTTMNIDWITIVINFFVCLIGNLLFIWNAFRVARNCTIWQSSSAATALIIETIYPTNLLCSMFCVPIAKIIFKKSFDYFAKKFMDLKKRIEEEEYEDNLANMINGNENSMMEANYTETFDTGANVFPGNGSSMDITSAPVTNVERNEREPNFGRTVVEEEELEEEEERMNMGGGSNRNLGRALPKDDNNPLIYVSEASDALGVANERNVLPIGNNSNTDLYSPAPMGSAANLNNLNNFSGANLRLENDNSALSLPVEND